MIHALLFGAALYLAPPKLVRDYPIGLQLYSVRDDCAKDFKGTLQAVARMGYSGVEFAGYYGHSAEELRRWLDEDHLKCYGSHVGLGDLLGDNFERTVAFNKTLGNHLVTVASLPGERTNTHAALVETARTFDDIARKLAPEGLMVAYHDHTGDFRMVDGELEWVTLFKNSHLLKIQFDIGHALEAGYQAEPLLKMFPGRLMSVHVTDWTNAKDKWLLGEGNEDWNNLIPYLKGRNGPRWFIVEQETYPYPPLESSEKSLRNFEAMMTGSKAQQTN